MTSHSTPAGVSPAILREVGMRDCDLFAAVTDRDVAEGTLQTLYRRATVHVAPAKGGGEDGGTSMANPPTPTMGPTDMAGL